MAATAQRESDMKENIPKVVSEGELKITDNFSIKLCVLDDGRRIIPEDDMQRVLSFLGITQEEFNEIINNKEL